MKVQDPYKSIFRFSLQSYLDHKLIKKLKLLHSFILSSMSMVISERSYDSSEKMHW